MATAQRPSKISRVDLRYRHVAQDVAQRGETERERRTDSTEGEEEPLPVDVNRPLLIPEQKARPIMRRPHRLFHRRAEVGPNILTVIVDVVNTIDANGRLIAQQTVTPALPPLAVPTIVLPSVPAVPPFPSTLTVPAYPWPSGVPSGVPTVGAGVPTSQAVITSAPPPTPVTEANPPATTPFPSSPGFNSTASSTSVTIASLSASSSMNSTSTFSTLSSSSSNFSSTSSIQTSSSMVLSTALASATGSGGGGPANPAPAPAATSAAAATSNSGNNTPLATPKVVGSVIGSLAGAALLLALLLFLIKRHKGKRREGALQLSGNDTGDDEPIAASGQQMATRSSFAPGAAAAFFNRFSATSRSTADSSGTGEKGFQRVSGRKLPSAWSGGMTSEQVARGELALSGSSFYRDDSGFYGGHGVATNKEFGKEIGESSSAGVMGTTERLMPGPQRTPTIHHAEDAPWGMNRNGGGSTLSPPHTPNPDHPPRGTLGRSHPSHDGSRSSRFTENV